ncbi:hypothetical protein D9613_007634 [Agrocybe pediades]|uniref:Auxin efflux carrier n=1 Tax=Agrocybe pediades TaxID=84607 RepID=A0A8H4QN90_9AGAR|nr:hypothetical protein D9613_007634 [Agrocybe pediades]
MVDAGTLIWISCRPLLRLMFCVSCGIGITKADIFPPVAAAGAGQVLLNITLPCLMFSKIVPAFTADNVGALGPLIFVALLYEGIGMLLAFIVKQFFWVPHRFRYGILVAGGWGNVGDIPTAVILSVTGAAPFSGIEDQNLSVAYISAFILVTLFPFGGHKLVAWDFQGPDIEHEEVRETMKLKRKAFFHLLSTPFSNRSSKHVSKEARFDDTITSEKATTDGILQKAALRRTFSLGDDGSTVVPTGSVTSPVSSPCATEVDYVHRGLDTLVDRADVEARPTICDTLSQVKAESSGPESLPTHLAAHEMQASPAEVPNVRRGKFPIYRRTIIESFKALLTPASLTIIFSFPIALIPKLKALFVQVPGTSMPAAPDGLPPLNFILDSTTFVGAASVPLGLVCLGSSLARLSMPKKGEWKKLPMGAIAGIAVSKMVIMPVLGVLICTGLTNVGIISKDDKVLRFVCIFISCLPTATVHVLLTQVYSGTGSSEHLAPFLIPQYIMMFISMTALTAYTLQLLF